MGSPRLISALLQRVGRAGHAIGAIPKGRLFPLSLDDLVECTALLDSVRRGELDRIRVPEKPLDVLAQQIVAEVACREWGVEELFDDFPPRTAIRGPDRGRIRAGPADARRGLLDPARPALGLPALRHRQPAAAPRRRGAKLTAVTNAGVIPDQFDYDVVLNPEGYRIGSIGEDFAFESMPGDIFQLGNTSYRIQKVEVNKVFVEDARGMAPTLPFWVGEAPARSDELSAAVSRLREEALGAARRRRIGRPRVVAARRQAAGCRRGRAARPVSRRRPGRTWVRFLRSAPSCSSASSTTWATPTSSSTRLSARASTGPGDSRCASASAASSTSNSRPRHSRTASCSRSGRRTASRSRT